MTCVKVLRSLWKPLKPSESQQFLTICSLWHTNFFLHDFYFWQTQGGARYYLVHYGIYMYNWMHFPGNLFDHLRRLCSKLLLAPAMALWQWTTSTWIKPTALRPDHVTLRRTCAPTGMMTATILIGCGSMARRQGNRTARTQTIQLALVQVRSCFIIQKDFIIHTTFWNFCSLLRFAFRLCV